jgi:hypothetical protein
MQQHEYDAMIQGEEQRFNMLKSEEVVLKYKSISLRHYKKEHEDEKL